MEYAVIQTGGKQYKVSRGDTIEVEKLAASPNDSYTFSDVLLHVADGKVTLGKPAVAGIFVQGIIVEQSKGPKLYISKFKAKARYRRITGHRQKLTKVRIEAIGTRPVAKQTMARNVERQSKKPAVKKRKK